jgi:hypothetical protein
MVADEVDAAGAGAAAADMEEVIKAFFERLG